MNDIVVIRTAEAGDIAALSAFAMQTYADAFGDSFAEADLLAHLNQHLLPSNFWRILGEDVVLVAELRGRLIGYVQFGDASRGDASRGDASRGDVQFSGSRIGRSRISGSRSADSCPADQELRRLYVHREFQNVGCGGALMEAALGRPRMDSAPSIFLDVWEHNLGAQRFYRRFGFEVVGSHKFLTESGASDGLELIMVRRASAVKASQTDFE